MRILRISPHRPVWPGEHYRTAWSHSLTAPGVDVAGLAATPNTPIRFRCAKSHSALPASSQDYGRVSPILSGGPFVPVPVWRCRDAASSGGLGGETGLRFPIPRPGTDYQIVWGSSRWFAMFTPRRPLFGSLRSHTRVARETCDQGPIAGGRRPGLRDFHPPPSRVVRSGLFTPEV